MKITVFAKTAHTKEGKPFIRFIGKMHKNGEEVNVVVKTSKSAQQLDESKCPYIIEFDKQDANMSTRKFTDSNNNERTSYTLWLKKWKESSEKYIDHSLDGFE